MNAQERLDETRRIAKDAEAARTVLRAQCAELERAKDDASDSPEAFAVACDALAAATQELDRADRAATRAGQLVQEAERTHSRTRLRGLISDLDGASAAAFAKVQSVATNLAALHASVADLESTLRQAGLLSDQANALAAECGAIEPVKSAEELRGLAVAMHLVALHELQFSAGNLQPWLRSPPTSLADLCDQVRLVLSYPSVTMMYRDLEPTIEEQLSAMIDGTFYKLLRERKAEEQRRINAGIEERKDEQRAQFQHDVAAAMRAGQTDRRTAVDRVMASLRYDASVVLPERAEAFEASP